MMTLRRSMGRMERQTAIGPICPAWLSFELRHSVTADRPLESVPTRRYNPTLDKSKAQTAIGEGEQLWL